MLHAQVPLSSWPLVPWANLLGEFNIQKPLLLQPHASTSPRTPGVEEMRLLTTDTLSLSIVGGMGQGNGSSARRYRPERTPQPLSPTPSTALPSIDGRCLGFPAGFIFRSPAGHRFPIGGI